MTDPLLEALPPATDYVTYLTIVEYNLSEEKLPVLYSVLEDNDLTQNIGWDLVQILLPYLPAAEPCLLRVCELGNPREVVLKVTEALRLIEFDSDAANDETTDEATGVKSLHVEQFKQLLFVLPRLHQRIQTQYPSRFLSTTLQAILAALSNAALDIDIEPMLAATIRCTERLIDDFAVNGTSPEDNSSDTSPKSDLAIVKKLLQSFLTQIAEISLTTLADSGQGGAPLPGLAWSGQLFEKYHPEKLVPGKPTVCAALAERADLRSRSHSLAQIDKLCFKCGLSNPLAATLIQDAEIEVNGNGEEDPPTSADEVSLSQLGCFFLFTERTFQLAIERKVVEGYRTHVFPEHWEILQAILLSNGFEELNNIGPQDPASIDALLAIGLYALESQQIGSADSDEDFNRYLQALSMVSANTPIDSLRYYAHHILTSVLMGHKSDAVRLSFILDTLQHCPYENLKASAVGWLKEETTRACNVVKSEESIDHNLFNTPVALQSIASFVFPNMTSVLGSPDAPEYWTSFQLYVPFILAALNFYYLLLCSKEWHERIGLLSLIAEHNLNNTFLQPLVQVVSDTQARLTARTAAENLDQAEKESIRMDTYLIEDALMRISNMGPLSESTTEKL